MSRFRLFRTNSISPKRLAFYQLRESYRIWAGGRFMYNVIREGNVKVTSRVEAMKDIKGGHTWKKQK